MATYVGPNSEQVSALQLPEGGPAIVNGRLVLVPLNGWIVTNPAGSQAVMDGTTFSQNYQLPAITTALIGAPNGVAGLNGSGLVIADPASKGQPNGVAGLDGNGNPAQTYLAKLADVTLAAAAASVVLSAIPATYSHLWVAWQAACDQATAQQLQLRFNADAGANYDGQLLQGNNTAASAATNEGVSSARVGSVTGTGAPAGQMASGRIDVVHYAAALRTQFLATSMRHDSDSTAGATFVETNGGNWRSTAAVTSITLFASTGNLTANSRVTLYGVL